MSLFSAEAGGQGFAFEAMVGLLVWIRQSTPHDRFACLIEPINLSSMKLAQKLGFRFIREVSYREKQFVLLAT